MARLFLIPNTLDLGCEPVALQAVLPRGVLEQAARLRHWVAEDAKTARAFLKRVNELEPLCVTLQEMDIQVLPRPAKGGRGGAGEGSGSRGERGERDEISRLLEPLRQGHDLGLISEAGLPAVADPGSALVAQAHQMGVVVAPLSGPNSMMLALAASGLQGQSFAFVGYVPQETVARAARLRELAARSQREGQTQILIETPYRNEALMAALLEQLPPAARLHVACGLTLAGGWAQTRTVAQWRGARPVFAKGLPAVFVFLV